MSSAKRKWTGLWSLKFGREERGADLDATTISMIVKRFLKLECNATIYTTSINLEP